MTSAKQAFHLIEQFSAQAPFAIWVTDAHGLTVFANHKLREILHSMHFMPEPLDLHLFHGPEAKELGLDDVCQKLIKGEVVDETIETAERCPDPEDAGCFSLHVVGYPLLSIDNRPENYVLILTDVTPSRIAQEKLRKKLHDVNILQTARLEREGRAAELLAEINRLEKEIKACEKKN